MKTILTLEYTIPSMCGTYLSVGVDQYWLIDGLREAGCRVRSSHVCKLLSGNFDAVRARRGAAIQMHPIETMIKNITM